MRSCNSPSEGPTSEAFEIFLNDRKSLGYSDFDPKFSNMIVPGNIEKFRAAEYVYKKTMV